MSHVAQTHFQRFNLFINPVLYVCVFSFGTIPLLCDLLVMSLDIKNHFEILQFKRLYTKIVITNARLTFIFLSYVDPHSYIYFIYIYTLYIPYSISAHTLILLIRKILCEE